MVEVTSEKCLVVLYRDSCHSKSEALVLSPKCTDSIQHPTINVVDFAIRGILRCFAC